MHLTYYDNCSYYIFGISKNIKTKGVQVIYSKCCPCGGDIEINTDTEGKYPVSYTHLTLPTTPYV